MTVMISANRLGDSPATLRRILLFVGCLVLLPSASSSVPKKCKEDVCFEAGRHRAKPRKKEPRRFCVQDNLCLKYDPADLDVDLRHELEQIGIEVTDDVLNSFVRLAPSPRTLSLIVVRDKYSHKDWSRWPHGTAKYMSTQFLRRAMELRLVSLTFADVGTNFVQNAGDVDYNGRVAAELAQLLRPYVERADGILFLLDASVIPPVLPRTIRREFPDLILLNAQTDIRKNDVNFPELAYDALRDTPPAFVKTTLSGRDKWSEFKSDDGGKGPPKERLWVEHSAKSIDILLKDPRYSVQRLLKDFRSPRNDDVKFQQRCMWAFGDLTCYEIASKSFIIKEGATRSRPTYSWFRRDHRALTFDHGTLLYSNGPIPRRLTFNYIYDEEYWNSIRRAIKTFVDAHDGPHLGVFELVRTSQDVATLFDVNPCPWELGWPALLIDVQVRSAHRMLHDVVGRHKSVRIMRHGESENNAGWDRLGRDPKIRDAPLTSEGKRQAILTGKKLCHVDSSLCGTRADHALLVVASPLSRAMNTAQLALASSSCTHYRSVLHPDLREWKRALADVGRVPLGGSDDDANNFFDTSLVPESWGSEDTFSSRENVQSLDARIVSFRRWLAKQKERCVLIVSHHDFLAELTGADVSLARGDVYPESSWSSTMGDLFVPRKRPLHCNETESSTRCVAE